MSPKAIAAAGLTALAIAASACSGDSDSGGELSAAFKKDFSTAPWIQHVTEVKVSSEASENHSNWLVVTTDLDEVGDTVQGAICNAGFQFADDHELDEIEAVQVIGSDGGDGGCA